MAGVCSLSSLAAAPFERKPSVPPPNPATIPTSPSFPRFPTLFSFPFAKVKLKDFAVEVHVWVHTSTAAIGLTLPRTLYSTSAFTLNHRVLTTLRPSV